MASRFIRGSVIQVKSTLLRLTRPPDLCLPGPGLDLQFDQRLLAAPAETLEDTVLKLSVLVSQTEVKHGPTFPVDKERFTHFLTFLSSVCLQKWKQLSRLQRSLILFILIFLFIFGIASYPTINQHLSGK